MRVDANALKASKKLSVPIAIAAPTKMGPAVIADKVVDERLLLLEVQVAISVITRTPRTHWYKRFSLCSARVMSRIVVLC